MRNIKKKNIITIIVLVIILSGISLVLYLRDQNRFSKIPGTSTANEEQIVKKERPQTILEQVSRLAELPEDEIPTISTVTDAEKLSTQPLFKNAKDGDRVLVFTKSGIAIIYRPSTGKIIEYSNVNLTK